MMLSEAVVALCEAAEANGLSGETVTSYRRHLAHLVNFCADKEVQSVSEEDLRQYALFLRRRLRETRSGTQQEGPGPERLSPHSVNSYLRSAKRLFAWLTSEGVIAGNPAQRVKLPRADLSEFKAASEVEIARMLEVCDSETREGVRDRALIAFMWSTGCRAGGVRGLKLRDCDLSRLRAIVLEKGAKRRSVFFEAWVAEALQAWLDVRPPTNQEWLFVGLGSRAFGRQLSQSALGQILRRRARQAGLEGRCNPHSLRHAFAVRYLRRGGSVGTLSQIMGHADVSTTVHYYGRLAEDQLAEQYHRFGGVEQ